MLLIGVIVSLVIHALIGYAAYNKPLGYVNVSQLQTATVPIRIRRASYDQYAESGQLGKSLGQPQSKSQTNRPTPAELSKTLLDTSPPPPPLRS
jgi:hypothetical protein